MKTLLFNGESYEAEQIVKTDTSIIGYIGETEVFCFKGISDFSLFELQGGEYDVDRIEQLESENARLKAADLDNKEAIATLYEMLLGGM